MIPVNGRDINAPFLVLLEVIASASLCFVSSKDINTVWYQIKEHQYTSNFQEFGLRILHRLRHHHQNPGRKQSLSEGESRKSVSNRDLWYVLENREQESFSLSSLYLSHQLPRPLLFQPSLYLPISFRQKDRTLIVGHGVSLLFSLIVTNPLIL